MSNKRFLNTISVQNKVFLILAVATIGLIAVWTVGFIGTKIAEPYQQEVDRTDHLRTAITKVDIEFLQERRNEKDFLIRLLDKYITRHAKVADEVEVTLDKALEVAIGDEVGEIEQIRATFGEYAAQFVKVSEMWKQIGLTSKDGLRGNLRNAVHDVEELIKAHDADAVLAAMLTLRRNEKDFIIRTDEKYLGKHKASMEKFYTKVDASSIPGGDKGKIKNLAAAYAKSFNALVDLRLAVKSEVKTLSKKYAEAEPILVALLEATTAKENATRDSLHDLQDQIEIVGIGVVFSIFIIVFGVSLVVGRSISVPIVQLNNEMRRISDGETLELGQRSGTDEIADMGNALFEFQTKMQEADRLQRETAEASQKGAETARAGKIDTLAKEFDAKISNVLEVISSASSELDSSAHTMSSIASQSSDRAGAAASASEEATTNVQTVASACEELSASIQEISRQSVQSNELAQLATADVERTENVVKELSESANRINEVVSMISDIAAQTNLLALNATIEAARAGEAGKGFAVVANEVKSLATQTGRATNEIGETITIVLGKVTESVEAINSVTGRIGEISAMISSISTAVDEQNSATAEISRNVAEAAKGTSDVNQNVSEVSRMAGEAGSASGKVQTAADELANQSNEMKNVVDSFLTGVRAV